MIITRQSITRGPVYKGGLDDLPAIPPIPEHYLQHEKLVEDLEAEQNNVPRRREQDEDNLTARGSDHVIATENEDDDRVYVTGLTNKPFRIRALGGYDPEEDFRHASRDILEEPSKLGGKSSSHRRGSESRRRINGRRRYKENDDEQEQHIKQKDINFNDPEPDAIFDDASETDEVIFSGQDEPYQIDLEAEMRNQAYDRPGMPTKFDKSKQNKPNDNENNGYHNEETEQTPVDEPKESRRVVSSRRKVKDDDDGEGSWVNDGIDEDMDIPSQSHQDIILAKAAEQDALARKQAEEDAAADAQQAAEDQQAAEEPENQRMYSPDYLKNDLRYIDQDDN